MPRTRSMGLRQRVVSMTLQLFLVLVSSIGMLPGTYAAPGDPTVPCADPRGCPDLSVNARKLNQWHADQQTFLSTDCAVQEGAVTQAGPRLLLRFTSNTPNDGQGDLIIGHPADHPDWFTLQTCHGHPHFKEYADYRLWTPYGYQMWTNLKATAPPEALSRDLLNDNPLVAREMVMGRKQGFCVIDVIPAAIPGVLPPGPPKYLSCTTNQGISVGWADEYQFLLDGQWIDITDVPSGPYVLEVEVNAEHFFQESDYSNNAAAVNILVPNHPGRGPHP